MSTRKRPRSPSEWFPLPTPIADACWYMACGRCNRTECPYSHHTYRDLIAHFTNNRAFRSDSHARKLWARNDHFNAYFAESAPGLWTAVLPVPLMNKVWQSFHSPDFTATMVEAMGLSDPAAGKLAVTAMMDERDCSLTKKLWGSVVLQGRRDEVERGREAFVALMERNYYRTGDARALHDIRQRLAMTRWQTRTVSPSSPTAPSPPHPCVQLLSRGSCPRPAECPALHEPYPTIIARLADTTPTHKPLPALDLVTHRFLPKLALLTAPPPSSQPTYVASLPLPCVPRFNACVMGMGCLHARFISSYCGLDQCRFTHANVSKNEQAQLEAEGLNGGSWLAVQGEGSAASVDRLLECVFSLLDEVKGKKYFVPEDTVLRMERPLERLGKGPEESGVG